MLLHQFVDQLIGNFAIAPDIKNKIANNINPLLQARVNRPTLRNLLNTLLHALTFYADNSYIQISAKCFHSIILVQVKHDGCHMSPVVKRSLEHVNDLAGKLGGCVYVTGNKPGTTTASFTFVNRSGHAEFLMFFPDNPLKSILGIYRNAVILNIMPNRGHFAPVKNIALSIQS